MERTKLCPMCGKHFSYEISRGTDKTYCGKTCSINARKQHLKVIRDTQQKSCKTEGCNGQATRIKSGLCECCYGRVRRNGNTDAPVYPHWWIANGYIKVLEPSHPLADSYGTVYAHRKVVYDSVGGSPQTCVWCGQQVSWKDLVIDHLNEDKKDNRLDNLVVSCNTCNRARGAVLPFLNHLSSDSLELFITQTRIYHKQHHDIKTGHEMGKHPL